LRAVNDGPNNEPVHACPAGDPRRYAASNDIKEAMRLLGLNPTKIRFLGCRGQLFAAYPDGIDGAGKYVISYPSDYEGDLTTPLMHELAHVLQMEVEGGQEKLRGRFDSLRIELGADYLAGVIYAKLFPGKNLDVLASNLKLTGSYGDERDINAHGKPSQRDAAFRYGANLQPDQIDSDMRKMSARFQGRIYAVVKTM
jgi:hypothetical protein